MPIPKKRAKLEEPEQILFFAHVGLLHACKKITDAEERLTYSVNSAGIRHIHRARLDKKMGIKKGTVDIHVDLPRNGYHGLKIELKAPIIKGLPKPSASAEQRQKLKDYNDEGYLALLCYGYNEAIKVYLDYMGIKERM